MYTENEYFRYTLKVFRIFICLLCYSQSFIAQERASTVLQVYSNLLPGNDSSYRLSNGTTVHLETFKLYLSNIKLIHDGKVVFTETGSFHLLDFADSTSLRIALSPKKNIKYNSVSFDIGIDSITNVSGAMSGDLDPITGMYWTWQSGYINCKLEGKFTSGGSTLRKFEFHLGGYAAPFASLQHLTIPVKAMKPVLSLEIDLLHFFESINTSTQKNILTPSSDAVNLLTLLAEGFGTK